MTGVGGRLAAAEILVRDAAKALTVSSTFLGETERARWKDWM